MEQHNGGIQMSSPLRREKQPCENKQDGNSNHYETLHEVRKAQLQQKGQAEWRMSPSTKTSHGNHSCSGCCSRPQKGSSSQFFASFKQKKSRKLRIPILTDFVEDRIYSRALSVSIYMMVTFIVASVVLQSVLRDAYNIPKNEWQVIKREELTSAPEEVKSGEHIPIFFQMRLTGASGHSAAGIKFDLSVIASVGHVNDGHFPVPLTKNSSNYRQAQSLLTPMMTGDTEFETDKSGILSVKDLIFVGATADVTVTLKARAGNLITENTADTCKITRVFRVLNDITSVVRLGFAGGPSEEYQDTINTVYPLPQISYLLLNSKGQPLDGRKCEIFTSEFSYPGSEDHRKTAIFTNKEAVSNRSGIVTFENVFMKSASADAHILNVYCGGIIVRYNQIPWRFVDDVHRLEWVGGPHEIQEGVPSSTPFRIRVLDAEGNPLVGKHVFANIIQEDGLEYSRSKPECVMCSVPSDVDSWGDPILSVSKRLQNPVSSPSDIDGIAQFDELQFSGEGFSGDYLLIFSSGKASLRAPHPTRVNGELWAAAVAKTDTLDFGELATFNASILNPSHCNPSLKRPFTFTSWNGGPYDPGHMYTNCDGSIRELSVLIGYINNTRSFPTGKVLFPYLAESYVGVPSMEKEGLPTVTIAYVTKPSSYYMVEFPELRITSSATGTHLFYLVDTYMVVGWFSVHVRNDLPSENDVHCSNIIILEQTFPRTVVAGQHFIGTVTVQARTYNGHPVGDLDVAVLTSKQSFLRKTSAVTDGQGIAHIPLEIDFVGTRESVFFKLGSWSENSTAPCSSDWIPLNFLPRIGWVSPTNIEENEGTVTNPIILFGSSPRIPTVSLKLLGLDGDHIDTGGFDTQFEVISFPSIYVEYPSYEDVREICTPIPYSDETCSVDASAVFFRNISASWNKDGLLDVTGQFSSDAPGWFMVSIVVDGVRMDRAITIWYQRNVDEVVIKEGPDDGASIVVGVSTIAGFEVKLLSGNSPVVGLRSRMYISSDNTTNFENGFWAICKVGASDGGRGIQCGDNMVNLVLSEPSDSSGIARFPDIVVASGNPCLGSSESCSGFGSVTFRFSAFDGYETVVSTEIIQVNVYNPIRAVQILTNPAEVISPSVPFVQQPEVQQVFGKESFHSPINFSYAVVAMTTEFPEGAEAVLYLQWQLQVSNPVLQLPFLMKRETIRPSDIACCYGTSGHGSSPVSFRALTFEFLQGSSILPPVPIDGEYGMKFCSLGVCSKRVSLEMKAQAEHLSILPHGSSTGLIEFPLDELRVKATVGGGIPVAKQRVYAVIYKQLTENDSEEISEGDFRRGKLVPSTMLSETGKDGIATFNLVLISGSGGTYLFEFFTVDGARSGPSKPITVSTLIRKTNILNPESISKDIELTDTFPTPIKVGGTVLQEEGQANPNLAGGIVQAYLDKETSNGAIVLGDTAIIGENGVAVFSDLRFSAGRSGKYRIYFVIQGVQSDFVEVSMTNPVEFDTSRLEHWWAFVLVFLILSIPLMTGNNMRNPRLFLHFGAVWSPIFLASFLTGAIQELQTQAEILSYPDPFFATLLMCAAVAGVYCVYLYIRMIVMEHFLERTPLQRKKSCYDWFCWLSNKCLDIIGHLMCIRNTYRNIEEGISLKDTVRESSTGILLDGDGYPIIPLENYFHVASNVTFYRRKLIYYKYLVHRLLPLGRRRFTETYNVLLKFRQELASAANSPLDLQMDMSNTDEFNLIERVTRARRQYLLAARLHLPQWRESDPALAKLILEPEGSLESLESSPCHVHFIEASFWRKTRHVKKVRQRLENKLQNMYEKSESLFMSFRNFFLEKYYKFRLTTAQTPRHHQLYETNSDFFFPQRILVSIGISFGLTLVVILGAIALARYLAFLLDDAEHLINANRIRSESGGAILQGNSQAVLEAVSAASDAEIAALSDNFEELEDVSSIIESTSKIVEGLAAGRSVGDVTKMLKLVIYVGVSLGSFFAIWVNIGSWRSFLSTYRSTILRGHEGSVRIDKYQSLAKSTRFIANHVWHSTIGALIVCSLMWFFVGALIILVHPDAGLVRNPPWLQYLYGILTASFVVNQVLKVIIVRFIMDRNVVRHRRIFSWLDVAHSMAALITGIASVIIRLTVCSCIHPCV